MKKAKNSQTGELVAIKIIEKSTLSESLLEALKKEITIMKRLQHPNIIQLKEVLGSNSKIFLVLEYIEGGALSQLFGKGKQLSEKSLRPLLR